MAKAAVDIPRPDGSVIKKGTELPSNLVDEFERCSPQLLDTYTTINSRYFKNIDGKLVPHKIVMEKDLIDRPKVKVENKEEIPKVEDPKIPKKKKKTGDK